MKSAGSPRPEHEEDSCSDTELVIVFIRSGGEGGSQLGVPVMRDAVMDDVSEFSRTKQGVDATYRAVSPYIS